MHKKLSIILFSIVLTSFAADNTLECSPAAKKADITQSVKWFRDSAEKKASYIQTYSIGSEYVQQWVKIHHPKPKSWGVVLDVDETILDNSWYFVACGDSIGSESDFSHYVANAQKSVALPGAVAFTTLVHKLGGYVSIVTNRDGSFADSSGNVMTTTIANLKAQQVYFDQVVLANLHDSATPSDKNPRFAAVINGKYDSKQMVWSNPLPPHKVIAYFGDNIQDFPHLKQESANSLSADNEAFKSFGNGNFIFPNPLYGSWQQNKYK